MEDINEIFGNAIMLRDSGRLTESIRELQRIILLLPEHPKIGEYTQFLEGFLMICMIMKTLKSFFKKQLMLTQTQNLLHLVSI